MVAFVLEDDGGEALDALEGVGKGLGRGVADVNVAVAEHFSPAAGLAEAALGPGPEAGGLTASARRS